MSIELLVNGAPVEVADEGASLLAVLREQLGISSAKDGCSPQGQCGCCTVLVDGAPRVACVTPVRRVRGRSIVTLEGLDAAARDAWGEAFCAAGASQCGFCTPGIILRLEAAVGRRPDGAAAGAVPSAGGPAAEAPGDRAGDLGGDGVDEPGSDREALDRALAAHLCRCTGWNTIREAAETYVAVRSGRGTPVGADRDLEAASRRASLEGHAHQRVDVSVALGGAGFADDTAPPGALVAVPSGDGGWSVGETLAEARRAAGKVQGRRTTVDARPPIPVPDGVWDLSLRTSWVEPAYLETDASWCEPGGEPASPLANGGAFGGKELSVVGAAARALADEHGRPVRVLLSREDAVRMGPKRPPLAAGLRRDGTGVVRVARTDGIAEAIRSVLPAVDIEEVDLPGPPTSVHLRAAGWAEAAVLHAVLQATATGSTELTVSSPAGALATSTVRPDGTIAVRVSCGDPLDEVVLRSYCIGAAHMALGWVTSEAIAVDDAGAVQDLTIRSFGIVRPAEMPHVEVEIDAAPPGRDPVNGSDAVLAAVAAAVWSAQGTPPVWPTLLGR